MRRYYTDVVSRPASTYETGIVLVALLSSLRRVGRRCSAAIVHDNRSRVS